jgi:hypothetical protein
MIRRMQFFDGLVHGPIRWDDGICCEGSAPGAQDLCSGKGSRAVSASQSILPACIFQRPFVGIFAEVISQSQQTLCSNGRSRTVDRLPGIVWIGRFLKVITQPVQIWSPCIPVGNAVDRRVFYKKITGGLRCLQHHAGQIRFPTPWYTQILSLI